MANDGFVDVQGGRLFYETSGTGHVLVLIHAGFLDRRMWDEQFELFAKHYRVVRYDVRGFGKSSRPTEKFSDIDDLNKLLTSLNIDKAYVVGVSNGGRIAIDFTANYPAKVDALVLVGSAVSGYETAGPEEDGVWSEFERQHMKPQEEMVKAGRIAKVVEMDVNTWGAAQSPRGRERLIQIGMNNSHTQTDPPGRLQVDPDPPGFKRLSEIKAPTLIIFGDRDVRGMRYVANQLNSKIPGSRLVEIHGADHIVNMSKPEEFNRTVLDFLGKVG